MMFSEFKNEVKSREGTGYHIISKYEENSRTKFAARSISVCDDYFAFIDEIGFGIFFNGGLVIFPLDDGDGSVITTTSHLRELGFHDLISIGYDGTTSGYFSLSTDPSNEQVYWIDIELKTKSKVANRFFEWIESQPKRLFNSKVFAGFKKISNPEKVLRVIAERKKFEVSLMSFDPILSRPPGKEKDILPRYNKVIFSIKKKESSDLKELTIPLHRKGSPIGDDNKEYVTVRVENLKVGVSQKIECYLFDPFNLPFKAIICSFDYRIDLGSKMRVRFKEIAEFL